ncbi:hypothetical protein H9P43_009386 [Blastocladiella emersonii ATCC 22665]|nr:hypothetical protein H9P43_009386 [Blastocladiella emersonii ATCC 22665]
MPPAKPGRPVSRRHAAAVATAASAAAAPASSSSSSSSSVATNPTASTAPAASAAPAPYAAPPRRSARPRKPNPRANLSCIPPCTFKSDSYAGLHIHEASCHVVDALLNQNARAPAVASGHQPGEIRRAAPSGPGGVFAAPPPPPLPPPLPPPQQQPQQHSQLEQQLQQDVVMQDSPENDSQDGVGSAEDAGTVTNLNGDVVMEDANAETVTNGAPAPVAETTSAAPATTVLAYGAKLPIGKHRVPGTTPPVPIGHEPIPRAVQQSPTLTDAPWDPFPDFVSWRFTFFCMVEAALSDREIDALINLINLIAAIVIVNKFGNLNMFPDRLLVKLPKGIVQRELVKKSAFYREFKCSVLTDSDGNKYNFITLSVVPSLLRGSRRGVTLDWLGNKFPNLLRGLTKAMAKHVLLDIDNRDANAALRPKDLTDAAGRVSQVRGFQCMEIHRTSDLDRQPIVEILKARVTESHGRLVNDFFVARRGNQGGLNIMEPILFLDFAVKGFDDRFQVAVGRWFSRFKPNSNTMLARDAITHLIRVRREDALAVVPVPAIVGPVHLVPTFLKHLVNGKPKKKPYYHLNWFIGREQFFQESDTAFDSILR